MSAVSDATCGLNLHLRCLDPSACFCLDIDLLTLLAPCGLQLFPNGEGDAGTLTGESDGEEGSGNR